jgi:hypothetical protein
MKKTLEERFIEFLDTLSGVESIDKLNMTQQQKDKKKADYFAGNRELIIELKSLETDTQPKIEKILEPHRSRPEFPMFFGGWEVQKILKHLPNGKEINKEMIEAVTSSIQTIYRSANKQIRTTKETFQLSDSQSLLIILNENIEVLSPDSIRYKLWRTAKKRNPNGSYQFTEISYVLVITEAHFFVIQNNIKSFPIMKLPIDFNEDFKHNGFIEFLVNEWAKHNSHILLDEGETNSPIDSRLESASRYVRDSEKTIPRHEAWRRYYRKNPYFRSYNDEMMKWMFKMIMGELAPAMLKGATQEQRKNHRFWLETFTHFQEEINHRGIDMMEFSSILKNLGNDIKLKMKERFPDLKIDGNQ